MTVLALLTVVLAVIVIVKVGGRDDNAGTQQRATPADSTVAGNDTPLHEEQQYDDTAAEVVLKPFDPNTADSLTLRQLGLAEWQVRNLMRYRQAGGVYQRKEDFARLYGLTVKKYRELEPYINIGADYLPASTLFTKQRQTAHDDTVSTPQYPVKLAEGETIDLGAADTAMLRHVPGIGPYYASRIAEYRQRLGGFVSIDQLDEIENFPQEAKAYFTLEPAATQRINVNSATVSQLSRHPYISFYQARAIVDYRRRQGAIADISDLRLLPDFSSDDIKRLEPYVEY